MAGTDMSADFYDRLEPATAKDLREAAERIRKRMKRSAEDITEIGSELLEIKKIVGHGEFLAWLALEFEMTERSAQRFMSVTERFGKNDKMSDLPISVIYELAAPSTPDEVVEAVIAQAAAGEKPTVSDVKKAKAKAATKRSKRSTLLTAEQEAQAAQAILDEGKSRKEVEAELGVSNTVIRRIVSEEVGRRDPIIDPSTLSLSAQEKLASAERQLRRRIEAEYDRRRMLEINQHIVDVLNPLMQAKLDEAARVVKARRGVMTRAVYRKIWACLHPDRLAALKAGTADAKLEARYAEAFNLFSDMEVVLCDEKEMPTERLVLTPEMMAARKAAVQAQRRARRTSKGNTHVQP